MTLLASCPPELRVNSIVTAEDWGRLEPYLRESFEIPTSVLRRDGLDAQLRDRLVEARLERHHAVGAKYFEGRGLTEKVMGNAAYHPSPMVLICPFDTCKKSHRGAQWRERRVAAVLALEGEAREQPDGDRAREAVAAGA